MSKSLCTSVSAMVNVRQNLPKPSLGSSGSPTENSEEYIFKFGGKKEMDNRTKARDALA
jgi:hypothetical protein